MKVPVLIHFFWNRLTDQLTKLITHCDYKWHRIDHLQYEGYLEHLLPNVPLENEIDGK